MELQTQVAVVVVRLEMVQVHFKRVAMVVQEL
jgi:hypothetical protein